MLPILGPYLASLDVIISDLQQKLDAKQEECMKQKEDMEVLAIKNEENDDIIKVKQRWEFFMFCFLATFHLTSLIF